MSFTRTRREHELKPRLKPFFMARKNASADYEPWEKPLVSSGAVGDQSRECELRSLLILLFPLVNNLMDVNFAPPSTSAKENRVAFFSRRSLLRLKKAGINVACCKTRARSDESSEE